MESAMLDDGSSEMEAAPSAETRGPSPILRLSDHCEVGQAFRSAYRLGTTIRCAQGGGAFVWDGAVCHLYGRRGCHLQGENHRPPAVCVRATTHRIVCGRLHSSARGICLPWHKCSKPKGSCVRVAHCQHIRTGEKCAVKLINAKHMDFDEPTIVQEILRLKIAQDAEMEGVAHFIALFKSDGATPFVQSCSTHSTTAARVCEHRLP